MFDLIAMPYFNHSANVYPTINVPEGFAFYTSMPVTEADNSWANWWDMEDIHCERPHWLEDQSGPTGLANWDGSLTTTTASKAPIVNPAPISGKNIHTWYPKEIECPPMMNSSAR
jgi:hypothetical protein